MGALKRIIMQTLKAKTGSLQLPQRRSPATPRTAQQLKPPGSDSDTVTSPNMSSKLPKDRSPKVTTGRSSPRSSIAEKKRPNRTSDLESQLARIQEDLKKTMDQLNTSESLKRRAEQDAEEAKNQLLAMSAKLEESQQQLLDLSASDDVRIQELRKISHDRDRAWQDELEAVQKQHSMDSAALVSAMNEIQKLKFQLERIAESEATQTRHVESAHAEVQKLRLELEETLTLVYKLKEEINECKKSESQAVEVMNETKRQLETAHATIEMLNAERTKAMESNNDLMLELQRSEARVKSLECLVGKLQAEVIVGNNRSTESIADIKLAQEIRENEKADNLKAELNSLKSEVVQLRSALDAAEIRYQEEYIQSTLQIRCCYEQLEKVKSDACQKEAELAVELKVLKADIEELKAQLMDKETELRRITEENKELSLKTVKSISSSGKESELAMELKKSDAILVELRASLLDKETQLQSITKENEILKMEIKNREIEKSKANEEAVSLAEEARAAREALMKLGYATEEADKSSITEAPVTEQLKAAQAVNLELQAELRRLKVQSDQWRKAAETAAAIISTGNHGKLFERTGSLHNHYDTISSPFLDDMDEDSPKKKNVNMLKKIGVLWKKGQK